MIPDLPFRPASAADVELLAGMNARLIKDEGHQNPMDLAQLKQRMREWINGEYRAILFELNGQVAAYALFCHGEQFGRPFVFLRQFFVERPFRRQGIGRDAIRILREKVWPPGIQVALDVLWHNESGRAFWGSLGFKPHSVTLLNLVP